MNILVTNFQNTGENVLVFVDEDKGLRLSPNSLIAALTATKQHFDDIYEIKDDEIRFHLFEPLWADEKFIRDVIRNAQRCSGKQTYDNLKRLGQPVRESLKY